MDWLCKGASVGDVSAILGSIDIGSVRSTDERSPSRTARTAAQGIRFQQSEPGVGAKQVTHYPEGRQQSAIIPAVWRAQEQHDGWLPEAAIRYVAEFLGMAHIRALEVATSTRCRAATLWDRPLISRFAAPRRAGCAAPTRCSTSCHKRIGHEPFVTSADGKSPGKKSSAWGPASPASWPIDRSPRRAAVCGPG